MALDRTIDQADLMHRINIRSYYGDATQGGSDDDNARSERAWTPPPKNYLDDFEKDSS
ncbi:Uncharacterised protein [BD1-7 clade bacterium]|uniref:Uncharacterized protein n=1 Tax=BD1-7 clade bacterium TaxID=2029982 RepID=A0A5S9Q691_9GAMM|nr:Uncharacterised protein [BD1-7 clade bacterium]CAA0112494.1 Uncharacterised protein [BD1-7 clade bacterium]